MGRIFGSGPGGENCRVRRYLKKEIEESGMIFG